MRFVKTFNVLAIGDLHFKAGNAIQTEIFSKSLFGYLAGLPKPLEAVAVLGDILHRHDKIDLEPMKRAIDFLKDLRGVLDSTTHLFIVIGNHDLPNNVAFQSDTHAFNALKLWHNTTVGDRTVAVTTPSGARFLLVPYTHPGRFFEAVGEHNLKDFTAVFAHQEFRGAIRCEDDLLPGGGSIIGDVYPGSSNAGVCISGHIHYYDDICVDNVIYPGSPFTHSWVKYPVRNNEIHSPLLLKFSDVALGGLTTKWSLKTKIRLDEISKPVPINVIISAPSINEIPNCHIEDCLANKRVKNIRVNVICSESTDLISVSRGNSEINEWRKRGVSFVPDVKRRSQTDSKKDHLENIQRAVRIPFAQRLKSDSGNSSLSELAKANLENILADI